MSINYRDIKNFLFDLDSTVWVWTALLPGVKQVIEKLERSDKKVYYVSNNALLSREGLAQKLTALGLRTLPEQIINAAYVAARYFEEKGVRKVYVIGENGLVEELGKRGISISEDAKHVVISTDRNFTYWKLKKAYDLVKDGAQLYCTGHGRYWKVGTEIYPAEEVIVRIVEYITGKTATLLGKPSSFMKTRLLEDIKLYPENTLLIGDDLHTDIALGERCGFRTALVLTGNSTKSDLQKVNSSERPTVVLNDIRDITVDF